MRTQREVTWSLGSQVEAAQRIQGFRGKQFVADLPRDLVAPAAQRLGLAGLIPVVPEDREPPQRFGHHCVVPGLLRRADGRSEARDRFGDPPRALLLPRLVQQVRAATHHADGAARRRPVGDPALTRQWHSQRSD